MYSFFPLSACLCRVATLTHISCSVCCLVALVYVSCVRAHFRDWDLLTVCFWLWVEDLIGNLYMQCGLLILILPIDRSRFLNHWGNSWCQFSRSFSLDGYILQSLAFTTWGIEIWLLPVAGVMWKMNWERSSIYCECSHLVSAVL